MQGNQKRLDSNKLLHNVEYMEGKLRKVIFLLFSVLILVQLFHHFKILQGFLNPVYIMEDKFFSGAATELKPKTLVVIGDIPKEEKVIIKKNGRPVGQVSNKNKVYIHLFERDVLEIDATKTGGEYKIFFECLNDSPLPDMLPKSIKVSSKLYRFPPF